MSAIPQCKVPIGTAYRPARFEHRTPTSYQALMPRPDRDAVRLQRVLLSDEAKAYLSDGFWLVFGVAVMGGTLFAGPLFRWLGLW